MKFTKEEARRIVLNCAKLYQSRLLHKKLLIIYRERRNNEIRYIEVIFHARNYKHLTGLELIGKDGTILPHQSMNFYRKCIENKLGLNEFCFRKDGTSHLKLAALPVLTDITKITNNHGRPYLFVDKVIGGVNFCLGLSQEGEAYVPSSALLEDIKKLTEASSQVLAILEFPSPFHHMQIPQFPVPNPLHHFIGMGLQIIPVPVRKPLAAQLFNDSGADRFDGL